MRNENPFADFFPGRSAKPSKYSNKRTEYSGEWYQSKAEANYAEQLDMLKMARDASLRPASIERQVEYPIVVNGIKICNYYADFRVVYNNRTDVIDVKGVKTEVYKIKKKLVEAIYKIKIKEINV